MRAGRGKFLAAECVDRFEVGLRLHYSNAQPPIIFVPLFRSY